ncbi:MAG TPA: hypothetical protein VJ841_00575 [Candidatus Saccharimonadales bacterium]|nr:hypothetical protein [Candidatus Saccharimonadales bacterium]
MIVHFIATSKNLDEDLPFLKKIIETIHDNGGVLARDWLGVVVNNGGNKASYRENDDKVDWNDVFNENMAAFNRSDLVIMDATRYSYQQGFFTALAISHKKPILVVTRASERHPIFGTKDKNLTIKHYDTEKEVEKIVDKFIKSNIVSSKDLRFNFLIDRQIYSYLRQTSYETGKNKSEIIRELLEQEIDRKD